MVFDSDRMHYRELLPQYAAGTVSSETRQRIATHLESCAACREALEEWRSIRAGLQRELAEKPPDVAAEQTWMALHSKLHSLPAQRSFPMHDTSSDHVELPAAHPVTPTSPRRRWMGFASVAAVALIILVSVILFNALGKARPSVGRNSATPAPVTSGCATPAQATLPRYTLLKNMSFVTPDDAWAVGLKFDDKHRTPITGVIYHLQHCQWQPYSISLPKVALDSITMVSADEGWAAGALYTDGSFSADQLQALVVLHYQHGQWQQITIPGTQQFVGGDIAMVSAQEGWLVGLGQGSRPNELLHYRNGIWSPAGLPANINQPIDSAVTPVGSDDVWFAIATALPTDGDFTSTLVHFRHGQVTSYPLPNDTSVSGLAFPGPEDGWMAGSVGNPNNSNVPQQPVLMHFDGKQWTNVSLPSFLPPSASQSASYFTGISLASSGEGFIIGYTNDDIDPISPIILLHLHEGQWQPYHLPALPALAHAATFSSAIAMVSSNEGWAFVRLPTFVQVGSVGYSAPSTVILHYLDGTWSIYEQ